MWAQKGKQVIPLEEQLKQALGLNEAITRGIAFKQAGADAVFIEAPETREEMLDIARWQSRSMRFIQLFVEKEQR
jgi:2-methylisocitrate lyase-like PEP mutase family enzyme